MQAAISFFISKACGECSTRLWRVGKASPQLLALCVIIVDVLVRDVPFVAERLALADELARLLLALLRPIPLFLPPSSCLFTVAQAQLSDPLVLSPFFLEPSSMCSAFLIHLAVYAPLPPRGIVHWSTFVGSPVCRRSSFPAYQCKDRVT